MRFISFIMLTICGASAYAQTITSFEIQNGWGSRYYSKYEEIVYKDSFSFHKIGNSTIEINQPDNQCTILGYPLIGTYVPVNANVIDAVYFYDSLTQASQFEVVLTPKMLKSINFLHNRKYNKDVDFNHFPFSIDEDTTIVLEPATLPKTQEISFICDGLGAYFNCNIVFDYTDTVMHEIQGNYDLSNSKYLNETLPIYCLFQQYPQVFQELNYFAPVKESEMIQIVFRCIDWYKTQALQMDGTKRRNIQIGSEVEIVEKHNQRSGELTDGFVERILTKSSTHPHGIKVKLETGEVGRVKTVIADPLDEID